MGTPRKRGGGPDAGVSFTTVTLPRTDAVRKAEIRSACRPVGFAFAAHTSLPDHAVRDHRWAIVLPAIILGTSPNSAGPRGDA
ncbi:hypothetical protein ASH04_22995 [Rhodococcus sp. Leaf233]|nr:hypothetical protein ASH04_22995 [Rhodococcus sp. Leaf233]